MNKCVCGNAITPDHTLDVLSPSLQEQVRKIVQGKCQHCTAEHLFSRRAVLQKLAYVTPVILTLSATPTFAGRGSGSRYTGKRNLPPVYRDDTPPVGERKARSIKKATGLGTITR